MGASTGQAKSLKEKLVLLPCGRMPSLNKKADAAGAHAGLIERLWDQQATAAAETQAQTVEPLSAREVKVLTLLSQGLSNKEVAAELHISVPTVKWYTSNIYAALAVSTRTQAIAKARHLNILPEQSAFFTASVLAHDYTKG